MLGSRSRGFCRGGLVTDAFLLIVFLALAFVFIQRRGYMNNVHSKLDNLSSSPGSSKAHAAGQGSHQPKMGSRTIDIDERIKKIPDARSMRCQSHSYTDDHPVTIIITFYDYQFYDLKTTVASVLHNTRHDLIGEIIIVDDGSTLDYIREESKTYAEKIKMVKLLRMSQKVGQARARTRAIEEAKTEYLVFLDTTVVCNAGWLPPLTELLRKEHSAIAVPHYDSIKNPISYEYAKTDWELLTTFSWSLTMRTSPSHVTNKDSIAPFINSPAIRGTAWAVRKLFLKRIGGFDESMNDVGGESLELSLRTWMCGGVIKILPCSRVGVLNLKDPVKVIMAENIRRIVELWMPEKRNFIFKHTNVQGAMDATEKTSLKARWQQLSALECQKFDWYQRTIIPDIYTPDMDAIAYGLLRCKSGRCARTGDDKRLDLGQCKPDQYKLHPIQMIFEQSKGGTIKTDGRCLTVLPSAYVVVEECRKGESKQQWEVKQNGVLRNLWSNYCAMHVTDPDKRVPKGRQIMMVQECPGDAAGMFVEFEFILP